MRFKSEKDAENHLQHVLIITAIMVSNVSPVWHVAIIGAAILLLVGLWASL